MQRWLWLFALAFAVAACGSEGDESGGAGTDGFRELTAADLVHKSFRFGPDAGIFEADDPRKGQPATLIVGEVYERSHGAGFGLTSDDGSRVEIAGHVVADHDGLHGMAAQGDRGQVAAEGDRQFQGVFEFLPSSNQR